MSALENLLLQKYQESVAKLPSRVEATDAGVPANQKLPPSSDQASLGQADEQPDDAVVDSSNASDLDLQPGENLANADAPVNDHAADARETEVDVAEYGTDNQACEQFAEVSSNLTYETHWSVEIATQVSYTPEPLSPPAFAHDQAEVSTEVSQQTVEKSEVVAKTSPSISAPATPPTALVPVGHADDTDGQHSVTEQASAEEGLEREASQDVQDSTDVTTQVLATATPQAAEEAVSPTLAVAEHARVEPEQPSNAAEPKSTEPNAGDVDSASPHVKFKAQWEVDSFLWPDFCGKLEAEVSKDLIAAVEHIQSEYESQSMDALMITAAQNGSGRTAITLCLAREAARQGKSVAIVDLDHQQPTLVNQLGVDIEAGIESLAESVDGESVCVKAVEDGITLLPLVSPIDSEKCLDQQIQDLLAVVAANHDIVLIDASADVAELLSSNVERLRFGTVVVDDKRVAANLFRNEIIERVRGKNCHPVGIIENFAA